MSLSAEKKAQFDSFWEKADVNKDGNVTIQEMSRVLKKEYGATMSDADVADIFSDIDASGDGKITKAEFLGEMQKKDRKTTMTEVFQEWDKDGSGCLSRAEVKQAMQSVSKKGHCYTDDQIDEMIDQVDKDKDGSINLKEFLAGV